VGKIKSVPRVLKSVASVIGVAKSDIKYKKQNYKFASLGNRHVQHSKNKE
jgi:hypothetical protein